MVQVALQDLTIQVEKMLPPVKQLSDHDLALILLVYDGAIRPFFMAWLGFAFSGVRSPEARRVLQANLLEETDEDHPAMLLNFTDSIRGMVEPADLAQNLRIIHSECRALTMLAAESPLNAIALIAALEVSSPIFIIWLAEAAERLNISDCSYVEEHGEADVQHAEDLQRVLPVELRVWGLADPEAVRSLLNHIFPLVYEFLMHIFHSHRAIYTLATK